MPIWCVPSDGGTPGLARPQPRAQHRNIALTAGLLEVLGKDGHPQIDAADGGVGAVGLVDVVGEAAGEEGGPGRRAIFEGVCAARQQGSAPLIPRCQAPPRHLPAPQRPLRSWARTLAVHDDALLHQRVDVRGARLLVAHPARVEVAEVVRQKEDDLPPAGTAGRGGVGVRAGTGAAAQRGDGVGVRARWA